MRILWIALALTLVSAPARGEGWFVGTNYGLALFHPRGGADDLITIGVPGNVGQLVPGFQPGLRLGILGNPGDIYLDGGLATLILSGESITAYQVGAGFQMAFPTAGSTSPFLNAGVGVLGESVQGNSFSQTLVGAGVGTLRPVAGGHGRVRTEVRFDYVFETTRGLDAGMLLGLRFGFDLLMQ